MYWFAVHLQCAASFVFFPDWRCRWFLSFLGYPMEESAHWNCVDGQTPPKRVSIQDNGARFEFDCTLAGYKALFFAENGHRSTNGEIAAARVVPTVEQYFQMTVNENQLPPLLFPCEAIKVDRTNAACASHGAQKWSKPMQDRVAFKDLDV